MEALDQYWLPRLMDSKGLLLSYSLCYSESLGHIDKQQISVE